MVRLRQATREKEAKDRKRSCTNVFLFKSRTEYQQRKRAFTFSIV